ncbi:hypothetical protein SS50377_22980 [Spironucleus salmonicida]|uniref:F-box/LRR-repeat protein 15/At3g58940/PEG3-like LRR domain-containing protein n=1 Tax=Spironucleus salmonicida TaxID=348837 RepID=V6LTQ8_9EUKA|nr:hypothetical protein SS50377_22980 [Spironucleus salmonicida]|eukprot:EST47975.1 Hypothetical protein SS50377_11887 [Spironucleus salmonicida]
MTDGARAADRGGDAPPESQGLLTATLPAAAELPDPSVAHLSLDGRWDAAVRLDALTSLALADMDGTEPLRCAESVRDLRLERVSGKMDVGPALARLTIVDSPIVCRNPHGGDLPNLTEVVISCTSKEFSEPCELASNWQPLLNILQGAKQLKNMTLNRSGTPYASAPDMSGLRQLEMLALNGITGSIYFPPSLRSVTLTKCTDSVFQCDADSLPDLRYICLDLIKCDQLSLDRILGRANGLRSLTLTYNDSFYYDYVMCPPQISRLKQLETLVLDGMKGDIYFHPSLRSVTLTQCSVNKFYCDADSLPDLRDIFLSHVTYVSTSMARVLQLAHGLQRLIVRGTAENSTTVLALYLQPSVVVLELDRVRLGRLVLVGAPCVERLRLCNIRITPDQLPALARLVRVRTVMHLNVSHIGAGSGQQDTASLQQFALPAFIRRPGVDIELAVQVGQRYVQRGSMVYQEDDSQPVALPTRLAAFVYRQKIEPLGVLCGALVE